MQANYAMASLLRDLGINVDSVCADNARSIWKKYDRTGRPYWGTFDFWNLDKGGVPEDQDLSSLEYDGNEIYLDAHSKTEIAGILKRGIGIMKAWKQHLEHNDPEIVFCLLATYDNGDMLMNKEDHPDGFFSLTLRFWAVRDGNTVVDLTSIDEWDQPALWDICHDCAVPAAERSLYPGKRYSRAEGGEIG